MNDVMPPINCEICSPIAPTLHFFYIFMPLNIIFLLCFVSIMIDNQLVGQINGAYFFDVIDSKTRISFSIYTLLYQFRIQFYSSVYNMYRHFNLRLLHFIFISCYFCKMISLEATLKKYNFF